MAMPFKIKLVTYAILVVLRKIWYMKFSNEFILESHISLKSVNNIGKFD